MKKTVAIITNASRSSGVGSRAHQLLHAMGQQEDFHIVPVMLDGGKNTLEIDGKTIQSLSRLPGVLGAKSVSWVRLAKSIPSYDIYDISNQTLSFIVKKRRPNIVTVHDIIELTDPQDTRARLLNKYLMSGIIHADKLVAVSEFTKKSIQDYFGIPPSTITVIPNGVDTACHPIPDFKDSLAYQELLHNYKIGNKSPILLYVGSEHPRKNMKTILETVALLKEQHPNVTLLKVGDPGLALGRKDTLEHIDRLHLRSNVLFLGNVPYTRLNELYNTADVLLFPSFHEGFGLPPLQAMAAGCPVVCSSATSLPEVVGDGAIMHSPEDTHAFAKSILHIMTDSEFKQMLIRKGKERAAIYSWKTAAEKTLALYRN